MRNLSGFTYTCYNAAFFCLVKAPAIALFFGFVFLSFNNSLSGMFLSQARQLTGNAPADKVQVCILKSPKEKTTDTTGIPTPPVYVKPEPCVTALIDASDWQQSNDSIIRQIYWNIVFLGFLSWLIINVNLVGVKDLIMEKIKAIKSRKEL